MVGLGLTSGVPGRERERERELRQEGMRTRESTSRRADGRTRSISANRGSDRSWEAQGGRVGQKLLFLWLQESSSGQAGTVADLVGRRSRESANVEAGKQSLSRQSPLQGVGPDLLFTRGTESRANGRRMRGGGGKGRGGSL